MQGRVHYYEGYTPLQVTFPMRVLGALGIRAVMLTNAAGGIQAGYEIGQLVAPGRPHQYDGLESAQRPQRASLCRPPRRRPALLRHDRGLQKPLRELAQDGRTEEGFALAEGVYLATHGPSFETPAEIRAFRALGATLVGMSTVPETIVARHMGIEVLGISCVTNLAAGLGATPLSHAEVYEAGRLVENRLALCSSALRRASPRKWKQNRDHGRRTARSCLTSGRRNAAPSLPADAAWSSPAVPAPARLRWPTSWRARWAACASISTTTISISDTCPSSSASVRTSTIRR